MAFRAKKQLKIVGAIILMFIFINLTLLRAVFDFKDQAKVSYHRYDDDTPIILIWHPPFKRANDYRADAGVCGDGVNCAVTYDRDYLEKSSALVFHFRSTRLNTMPQKRNSNQLYVWWSGEKDHKNNWKNFDDFFNLTFTYRRDSGVYAPYGSTNIILDELRKANELDVESLLQRKRKSRKLAAWAVSNCGVHRRMTLAKDMMAAGLDLDTFGACFENRQIGDGENTDSFYDALADYKFYLAFENGYHCKDYITEKFWYNGLRSGAVPIVWGPKKEDVEAVAPKDSFIHVDDFENVEELVNYIIYLSTNEEAYRKYLNWRTWVANPELMEERFKSRDDLHSFCKLCQIVTAQKHGMKRELKVPSLRHWWWEEENRECIHSDILDFEIPQDGVREILAKVGKFDML